MTPDQIDAIKTQKDPNSCNRPEPKVVCSITFPDGSKLENQTPEDTLDYLQGEFELGDLGTFTVKMEEETDEFI